MISFGFSFEFSNNGLVIFADEILYGHGSFMDGFIKLDLNVSSHSSVNSASSYVIGSNNIDSATWHARLVITTQIVLFHTLNTPGFEHFLRSNQPN